MRLGTTEIRWVAVEPWPLGAFRAYGPHGRFLYLQLGIGTLELVRLSERGMAER